MFRFTPPPIRTLIVAFGLAVAIPGSSTRASQTQTPAPAERYAVRDVMIPVRDGTKLFTRIKAEDEQAVIRRFLAHGS